MALSTQNKLISQLAPEQQKAIRKFTKHFSEWEKMMTYPPPHQILPTDFFAFAVEAFPKLSHESSWIWNQTNGRVSIEVESSSINGNNTSTAANGDVKSEPIDPNEKSIITLQKLNARKRRGFPKAPSFKVWQYHLTQRQHPQKLFAIWCEKGVSATPDKVDSTPNTQPNAQTEVLPVLHNFSNSLIPTVQQVKEFHELPKPLKDNMLQKRTRDQINEHISVPLPPPKSPKLSYEAHSPNSHPVLSVPLHQHPMAIPSSASISSFSLSSSTFNPPLQALSAMPNAHHQNNPPLMRPVAHMHPGTSPMPLLGSNIPSASLLDSHSRAMMEHSSHLHPHSRSIPLPNMPGSMSNMMDSHGHPRMSLPNMSGSSILDSRPLSGSGSNNNNNNNNPGSMSITSGMGNMLSPPVPSLGISGNGNMNNLAMKLPTDNSGALSTLSELCASNNSVHMINGTSKHNNNGSQDRDGRGLHYSLNDSSDIMHISGDNYGASNGSHLPGSVNNSVSGANNVSGPLNGAYAHSPRQQLPTSNTMSYMEPNSTNNSSSYDQRMSSSATHDPSATQSIGNNNNNNNNNNNSSLPIKKETSYDHYSNNNTDTTHNANITSNSSNNSSDNFNSNIINSNNFTDAVAYRYGPM